MERGKKPETALAHAFITMRGANRDDPAALLDAFEEATAELGGVVAERESYSKADAADLLEVSAPTVDKWVSMGLLPLRKAPGYKRLRVPAKPLLQLATEVKELRRLGRKRGLLAEALSRLEQEDPAFKDEFERLYGKTLASDDDFVSAAPGPE